MSLSWNIKDCANFAELMEGEQWKITEAIIWGLLAIDIGTITEKNVDDVARRFAMWQDVNGPLLYGQTTITTADIRRRVGMRTNVTTKTDASFRAKIARCVAENAARRERLAAQGM